MKIKNILVNIYNSNFKEKYTKLFLISDYANWSLDWDAKALKQIADKIMMKSLISEYYGIYNQSVFFMSRYILNNMEKYLKNNNRIALPYYHGYPDNGNKDFDLCFKNLIKYKKYIDRIQVSHQKMKHIMLSKGIDESKVFLIRIGIDLNIFKPQTKESKEINRAKYNIPDNVYVIGSFQKDGNGWGEGLEPKMIKGPDTFLETIKILKESVKKLFVLISGPARGYIKKGLEEINVPYKHAYLNNYPEICNLYHCLDQYIVSSREEGGPKAVLESMACGIPLITTKVGQAVDIVKQGENGYLADIEDCEGLANYSQKVYADNLIRNKLITNGLKTAQENSYESQIPLWKKFYKGFVEY